MKIQIEMIRIQFWQKMKIRMVMIQIQSWPLDDEDSDGHDWIAIYWVEQKTETSGA